MNIGSTQQSTLAPIGIGLILGLWLGFAFLFLAIRIEGTRTDFLNLYSNVYGVLPVLGALIGFTRLRRSSFRFSNRDNLVPTLFSSGLLLWGLGNLTWLYFNFVEGATIPYPAPSDFGFFPSLLLWTAGLVILHDAIVDSMIDEIRTYWPFLSTAVFFTGIVMLWARGGSLNAFDPSVNPIKFLFDVGYPMVDAFNIVMLFSLVTGKFRSRIVQGRRALWVILAGLVFMFLADLDFTVATSFAARESNHPLAYYNGGLADFLYLTAVAILSVGTLLYPLDIPLLSNQLGPNSPGLESRNAVTLPVAPSVEQGGRSRELLQDEEEQEIQAVQDRSSDFSK